MGPLGMRASSKGCRLPLFRSGLGRAGSGRRRGTLFRALADHRMPLRPLPPPPHRPPRRFSARLRGGRRAPDPQEKRRQPGPHPRSVQAD